MPGGDERVARLHVLHALHALGKGIRPYGSSVGAEQAEGEPVVHTRGSQEKSHAVLYQEKRSDTGFSLRRH